jgi:hypothetical protein
MRTAFYRVGIGLYFVWLLATVGLILGRYTPFPMLSQARTAVVTGGVVVTIFGAMKIGRDGYRRVIGS